MLMCSGRGKGRDSFPQYAAEGRREGLARVYNQPLSSGPYGHEYEGKVRHWRFSFEDGMLGPSHSDWLVC